MKGQLRICDKPCKQHPQLREMKNRHAWPIQILSGSKTDKVYFVYSHEQRKYYRWLDTLTGDFLSQLMDNHGHESGRYLEPGECIQITVGGNK